MSRPTLRLLAALLITLIIVVIINAFDHLPGDVRARIDIERGALASARGQLRDAQDQVTRETRSEANLFGSLAAARQWPARFQDAANNLQLATRDMDALSDLEKHGHYRDRQKAETLLSHERGLLQSASAQTAAIPNEAARWISRKQQLPAELQQMERDYQAIHNFDLAPLDGAVQRAEMDWPDKKGDLESRLASVHAIISQDDDLWQATAARRSQAAAGPPDSLDVGALLTAADHLTADAAALPRQSGELQSLAAQLYDSWDRVLVDMDVRGSGPSRDYEQKIRTVRTHLAATTSDEHWVSVSPAAYDALRNDLGMAIEHKPAGKYDSEAERVAQPAGFAYVAPPSQGANQYGYWEHRDGHSFWVFYGQYALLRDLLFNRSYRPVDRDEWDGYRADRSQGRTYYGHDPESAPGAPKYGTSGSATQDRYSGSTYARNGGFRNSPYASRSGSYRDSPYASPLARGGESDRAPKTFGRNSRPEEPRAAPPEHSYRPAPRAPPRRFPSGGGRRFGRRGR